MDYLDSTRFTTLFLVSVLLFIPAESVDSYPNGVGEIGNDGCLCHGESNQKTEIAILGLPDKFESNTNYALEIVLTNDNVKISEQSAQGGFRMLVDSGRVEFNDSQGIFLDDGWTHRETSNQQRSWRFLWYSPSDNTTMAKFTVNGNVVNGNNQSDGDVWDRTVIYVPGVQNFDPIPSEIQSEHELELFDRAMLISGLIALLYICYRTIRD
ncbi:MAG: choice-of-anchor V domain-containing protein [Candidatus Thermoplasmatota archaeon]|nr:choice-of-anchor V domain-containing protein [Candidatus Thermoplasmatota archaeon]